MIGQSHIHAIKERIADLQRQHAFAADDRLRRTLHGLINNEERRLKQWERLVEIRETDGE